MSYTDSQRIGRIEAVVFDNPSLNKAFEWAINQESQSVTSQYSKTLAEAIKRIREIIISPEVS